VLHGKYSCPFFVDQYLHLILYYWLHFLDQNNKATFFPDTDEVSEANTQVAIREVLRPKMFKLWKSAVDSSLALLLDDAEANDLTPDLLLTLVEEFSLTSQAAEHSFPALLVTNGEVNTESLSAEYKNDDESETRIAGNDEGQDEQSPDLCDDEHFELDMFERLESSVPLGSLPIDSMIEQLNSE
jgi:hypothetical protein